MMIIILVRRSRLTSLYSPFSAMSWNGRPPVVKRAVSRATDELTKNTHKEGQGRRNTELDRKSGCRMVDLDTLLAGWLADHQAEEIG